MVKVITYGTYDLLHYGHIRLLKRAKALGDYLIVGVTSDDFDKSRGKINVQQSLSERIDAVRKTGIADQIIVEEYEGQKIEDILNYGIDIFAIGSDWKGKFDYLKEYCKVVYLDRTEGISSTELRKREGGLRLGLVGDSDYLDKFAGECTFVNGITLSGICTENCSILKNHLGRLPLITNDIEKLLAVSDAVYIRSHPTEHFKQIRKALEAGKHVLCESPLVLKSEDLKELEALADERGLVFMEAIKTAYAQAYVRLLLLLKSGRIGKIVSVNATCTSIRPIDFKNPQQKKWNWNSMFEWGPTALLPVFQLLGSDYDDIRISSHFIDKDPRYDVFSKVDFWYPHSFASIMVGNMIKSEGDMIISGTKGYIYVPAPWWKTDYFEIRYENPANNKRYFYQLDGEGIRYELVAFSRAIVMGKNTSQISRKISQSITKVMEMFSQRENLFEIK